MEFYKAIGNRFLRGFIAGFVGAVSTLAPLTANSWTDLQTWFVVAIFAGIAGGITGGVLALDKALRFEE